MYVRARRSLRRLSTRTKRPCCRTPMYGKITRHRCCTTIFRRYGDGLPSAARIARTTVFKSETTRARSTANIHIIRLLLLYGCHPLLPGTLTNDCARRLYGAQISHVGFKRCLFFPHPFVLCKLKTSINTLATLSVHRVCITTPDGEAIQVLCLISVCIMRFFVFTDVKILPRNIQTYHLPVGWVKTTRGRRSPSTRYDIICSFGVYTRTSYYDAGNEFFFTVLVLPEKTKGTPNARRLGKQNKCA